MSLPTFGREKKYTWYYFAYNRFFDKQWSFNCKPQSLLNPLFLGTGGAKKTSISAKISVNAAQLQQNWGACTFVCWNCLENVNSAIWNDIKNEFFAIYQNTLPRKLVPTLRNACRTQEKTQSIIISWGNTRWHCDYQDTFLPILLSLLSAAANLLTAKIKGDNDKEKICKH